MSDSSGSSGSSDSIVHVIGGGLAGSEAAWQLAQAGVPVALHEMRPLRPTAAHRTGGYAELVCSNSFRSDDARHNAVGLLHEEMRRLGSLIMRAADAHQVPAGGALAVDRDGFSAAVTAALEGHPLITLHRGEVALPPDDWDNVIIATGPLTSPDLAAAIRRLTGEEQLAFWATWQEGMEETIRGHSRRIEGLAAAVDRLPGRVAEMVDTVYNRVRADATAREKSGRTDAGRELADAAERSRGKALGDVGVSGKLSIELVAVVHEAIAAGAVAPGGLLRTVV